MADPSTDPFIGEPRLAVEAEPPRLFGFWSLIVAQFQGAFSDNALKWLVGFLVLAHPMPQQQRDFYFVLVVPLLFAVPFLLFSIPGGFFADRYSKRSVTVGTRVFELAVMSLTTFALAHGRLDLAGLALFLVSSQAAVFGPSKYGLLPELLPVSRLSWGNGIIELGTLLAAITGTLAGGLLATFFRGRQVWSGVLFAGLSVVGIVASLCITRMPAADPARRFPWNWAGELFREVQRMRRDALLWLAVVANTFFWFLASLLLLCIVLYATDILRVDEAHSSYLLGALMLGIGIGSFAAGYASRGRIEAGMVLPSLAGLALFTGLLSLPGLRYTTMLWLLSGLGFCGGFFCVPVNAMIQHRPTIGEKGRVIAVANLLSFVGVALQPVAQYAMIHLGHPSPSRVFLISAVLSLLMGLVLWRMLPELWGAAVRWTGASRSAILPPSEGSGAQEL